MFVVVEETFDVDGIKADSSSFTPPRYHSNLEGSSAFTNVLNDVASVVATSLSATASSQYDTSSVLAVPTPTVVIVISAMSLSAVPLVD